MSLRLHDSIMTLSTVWGRSLADAVLAPRRFMRVMPEFRRVSDMLFHPGVGSMVVTDLPVPEEPVKMLALAPGFGGMPAQDLYALSRMVCWARPRTIFEIGTFQGTTTAHMALNSSAEIYTLDLPRDLVTDLANYTGNYSAHLQTREQIGAYYHQFNGSNRIHQLYGDSRTFDYGAYLGKMDMVLVDACHLFNYVISDSLKAFELLSPRGAILWHDFGSSHDVVRALQFIAKKRRVVHLEETTLALYTQGMSEFEIPASYGAECVTSKPSRRA